MRAETRSRWSKILAVNGVAALVGSALLAAALPALGMAYGLYESPPTLTIVASLPTPAQVPELGQGDDFLNGFVFDTPLNGFVLAQTAPGYGGFLGVIPWGGGYSQVGEQPCSGEVGDLYYPGTGFDLFVQCWPAGESQSIYAPSWIETVNATTLLPVSNVSLGSGSPVWQYALDPAKDWLFTVGYDGRLRTLDLQEGVVRSNLSLPGGGRGYSDPLWFDPGTDRLFTGDPGNASLLAVDPATGRVLSLTTVPGWVTSISEDVQYDRLYVGFDVGGPEVGPGGIAIFNATSLALVSTILPSDRPLGFLTFAFIDRKDHDVVLTNGAQSCFVDEITGQLAAAPALTYYGTGPFVAYDPSNGVMGVASGEPTSVAAFYTFSRSYSTPVPYSTFPVFGVQAPLDFGAIAFVVALGLFAVRRFGFHVPYEELPPRFEDNELRESRGGAAAAEVARQRWLAEDAKRGGPKP